MLNNDNIVVVIFIEICSSDGECEIGLGECFDLFSPLISFSQGKTGWPL